MVFILGVNMQAKIKVVAAMLIFGSIGVLVRNIDLSPGETAFLRAVIGSIFLLGTSFFLGHKFSSESVKRNAPLLIFSGAALGTNWIFLFQAYEYTSIANATLSYYFAPIFVILLAPLILKERLTPAKTASIFVAMLGLFLIVKAGNGGTVYSHNFIGIIYGLSASVLYAGVTLMNKLIKNLSGFETTLIQLMCAALVLLPYVALKNGLAFQGAFAGANFRLITLILIIGIVHTGFVYFLYFTAIKELKAQTIAVLSYIDPVSAVIIAAIFLSEPLGTLQIVGGILILGSASFPLRHDKCFSSHR